MVGNGLRHLLRHLSGLHPDDDRSEDTPTHSGFGIQLCAALGLCFCQRARRPCSFQRHAGSCRPPRLLRRLAGYQEQVETRHRQARPQPGLREKACLDDEKLSCFYYFKCKKSQSLSR